jgi:Arc/MetJ-type ribon-helix-helix transcriptional regulator
VGSEQRLETVNIRLPDELLSMLDALVERGIFANRSEAIREFAREYILEQRRGTGTGGVAGA